MRKLLVTLGVLAILAGLYLIGRTAIAAMVEVDATIFTTNQSTQHSGPQVVWTSANNGYVFYTDAGGGISMASTTNGGTSWSTPRNVDSSNSTDAVSVSVWWEGWTPGTTTTQYIHIATVDLASDDNYYTRLDTTTGAFSISVAGAANSATCARGTDCYTAITQGSDGRLAMITGDASDVTMSTCTSSCTATTSWSDMGNGAVAASAGDAGNDYYYMSPIPGTNNIMLVYWDITTDTMDYNIWSATSSSWWATVNSYTATSSAEDNTSFDAQLAGIAVSTTTGLIHFAYVDDADTYATPDHDMKWLTFSTSTWSWTAVNSVALNVTGGILGVKPAVDATNGTLYAIYARCADTFTTSARVYYRSSTDGGSTWSAESSALSSADDEINGLGVNPLSNYRISAIWNMANGGSADREYHETIVAITAGGGGGSTPAFRENVVFFE